MTIKQLERMAKEADKYRRDVQIERVGNNDLHVKVSIEGEYVCTIHNDAVVEIDALSGLYVEEFRLVRTVAENLPKLLYG